MSRCLIDDFKAARRVSVPIVAVTTPDPAATIAALSAALNGKQEPPPILVWDVVEGLGFANEPGKAARANLVSDFDETVGNPLAALKLARRMPGGAVLFFHLASRWLVDPSVVQAAWNLRDLFKSDRRTLVMLASAIDLPAELGWVIPRRRAGREWCEVLDRAIEAVQGLPAFQAEQVVAMSLGKNGLDVDNLWDRKRRQIELTPGLKVNRERVGFDDVGGVAAIKGFLRQILAGQARPNAVVFIDEIEKFLAGASGGGHDTSGVSQDQLGTLLSYMQDQQAAGCIFVGPPGSAKSMVAKAAGNEGSVPTIQLDLGGMKGSLVGQSEQNLRAALKVITACSNGRSLWIATCNAISDLPPELRRRFTLGTYFFDLPDADERAAIWKIYRARYAITGPTPADDGWTGAEIKQCCDLAWRLGCSLADAARYVVPVSRSAADQLERLRKGAEGRFLSASRGGVYTRETQSAPGDAQARPRRRAMAAVEE